MQEASGAQSLCAGVRHDFGSVGTWSRDQTRRNSCVQSCGCNLLNLDCVLYLGFLSLPFIPMATRRPASARTRGNSTAMPPPQQVSKPKSSSRPPSVLRSVEETSEAASSKPARSQDGSETNIQVILRCRGRSNREMEANSPSIVTIENAKTKELTIETSAPVSSLGMVARPPTRTYPFDLVFGPDATQSMIYHDVVGPMLNEVVMGYNCTLFAYGQTGTGKTWVILRQTLVKI